MDGFRLRSLLKRLFFLSSWHQHYIALCPPLVVPLYLGRGLSVITSFQLMQSLPCCKLLRLMPWGPVLGSDMSHSSMVLMEVEGGASAHSQSQLHRCCVSLSHGHLLWAEPAHGRLFNSRKQWHGLTAAPQKVLGCKSPEVDCFVWLLHFPKYSAVCSSQKLFCVFLPDLQTKTQCRIHLMCWAVQRDDTCPSDAAQNLKH